MSRRSGRWLPTAAGDVVMAFGIFGLATLPRLPGATEEVMQAFTAALLGLWLWFAAHYATSLMRGGAARHSRDSFNRFAIGTWVAGTGVTGELLAHTWPWLAALDYVLLAIAVAAWLWLMWLAGSAVPRLIGHPHRGPGSTPAVLLATVSTQALVLLTDALIPLPRAVEATLISFGYALYAAGLALIVWRYARAHDESIIAHSANTQCIIHGALSISGLAVVTSGALPIAVAVATGIATVGLFVAVECIEAVRLVERIQRYGWRHGVFTYRVSQWVRNFTFGMFYAFTVELRHNPGAHHELLRVHLDTLTRVVADYGQYVVLALLLLESALWATRQFNRRASCSIED